MVPNRTVVREKRTSWHDATHKQPLKGVVISQTDREDVVVVRWEGGNSGEWEETIHSLEVLEESPLVDGTRAYSG